MPRPYCYNDARRTLHNLYDDLLILCGDIVGPSSSTWQDVAGTAITNLRAYADMLEQARAGNFADGGTLVFPHPTDA